MPSSYIVNAGPRSRITDAPVELSGVKALSASVGVSASVSMTLGVESTGPVIVWQELSAGPAVSPAAAMTLKNARALAAGLGISPAVVEVLINPRSLAASHTVAAGVAETLKNARALAASPALVASVAEVLTNPRALAAAVGITPSVAEALQNARALAAAIGVSPAVAMALTKPSTFLPTSITGCVAWFDMSDAASYTNASGFITSITNKVSSVAWTEAVAPPAYLATGLNSMPTLDFNGTSQLIMSTEAAVVNALKDSLAHTIFIVMAPDNADRTEAIFAVGAAATQSNRVKLWGKSNVGAGKYQMNAANDAASTFAPLSTGIPTTVAQVAEYRASTTQAWIQINGATADPIATAFACGTLSADRSAFGARPDLTPDLFFDGKIAEVIVYNNEASAPDRSTVRQYLGTKWGVTVTP